MSTDTDTDEFRYDAYRVGRPTRTVEVQSADGTNTIEEGTLTFDVVCTDEARISREEGWWVSHYVGPDGGFGFGIGEDNPGGVAVRYDLEGIIEFPDPMTDEEAGEWLDDNPEEWEQFRDDEITSDVTAADLLDGEVR